MMFKYELKIIIYYTPIMFPLVFSRLQLNMNPHKQYQLNGAVINFN